MKMFCGHLDSVSFQINDLKTQVAFLFAGNWDFVFKCTSYEAKGSIMLNDREFRL